MKKYIIFFLVVFSACFINVYAEEAIGGGTVTDCPLNGAVYTIEYHSNGGSEPPSKTILGGTMDEMLPVPMKSGYTFLGWYYDEGFTAKVETEMITKLKYEVQKDENGCYVTPKVHLYAKWDEVIVEEVKNPETGYFINIMIVLLICLSSCYIYKFSSKYKKYKSI